MSGQGQEPEWAPYDYTDGRKPLEWKSDYPSDARKYIRWETAYLLVILSVCVCGIFYVIYQTCEVSEDPSSSATFQNPQCPNAIFWGFLGALLAGTLGGCCFGIKCMYHFVAKLMWHEDRRLWRLLSPLVSGVLSLIMVFLVASGLLQIFDSKFVEHSIRVMAFSFLVGYFSDKALAKMAEVADTLFGSSKIEKKKPHEQSPRQ